MPVAWEVLLRRCVLNKTLKEVVKSEGRNDEEDGERGSWALIWVGGSGRLPRGGDVQAETSGGLRVNRVWSSTELAKLEEVKEACVVGGAKGAKSVERWVRSQGSLRTRCLSFLVWILSLG